MPLLGPNTHDLQKLHSEVTQIVNQRLLITTLSVTVFGGGIAWFIARDVPSEPTPTGGFIYMAALLLTLVLFLLFLLNHHLTGMLRLMTTYLDEMETSNWERDWKAYRDSFFYWGYTKPQTMVFLFLGLISSMLPFLLIITCPFTVEPIYGAGICLAAAFFYLIVVSGMGWRGWFANEEKFRRHWRRLKWEGKICACLGRDCLRP